MALPQQLKTARITDDTIGKNIDDAIGELEAILCDVFGFTIDSNITESPLGCDNAGRITKPILRMLGDASYVGIRVRHVGTGGEFMIVNSAGTALGIFRNDGTEETPSWEWLCDMTLVDGLWTFATPPTAAADPDGDDKLCRKAYVDAQGAATLAAAEAYTDGKLPGPFAILQNRRTQNTSGGTATSGSWGIVPLNVEYEDEESVVDSSALPAFSLGAGTYIIEAVMPFEATSYTATRLYNVTDGAVQANVNSLDIYGESVEAAPSYSVGTQSHLMGTFTLLGTKQLRLEYRVNTTQATYGHGRAANYGTEVFAQAKITKIA